MGLYVCAHQNRDDRLLVRTQVKILQVKRVVMRLLDTGALELMGTDLELDNENQATNNENNVRTLAHSRNRKLEKYLPLQTSRKHILQNFDLCLPSVLLLVFKTEPVAAGKRTEYLVIIGNQEFRDTRVEIGGVGHDAWIIRNTLKPTKKKAAISAAFLPVFWRRPHQTLL